MPDDIADYDAIIQDQWDRLQPVAARLERIAALRQRGRIDEEEMWDRLWPLIRLARRRLKRIKRAMDAKESLAP